MHPVPGVDFGHLGLQLVAVTLDEAAHGDEGAAAAVAGVSAVETALGLNLLEEDVDGLLLGVADEAAGVDDDDVAVIARAVEVDLVACMGEVSGDVLGVDGVLAASEGDDIDALAHLSVCPDTGSKRLSTKASASNTCRSVIFSPRPM